MERLRKLIIRYNQCKLNEMRGLRNAEYSTLEECFDEAQVAICHVVQALQGIVSEDIILAAVGDAKSPNAVSRALRSRFSSSWFKNI